MGNTPNVHYTSKDFSSIFKDLSDSVPALTNLWTSKEDSDPGVVLMKLIAATADMLNFNMDKQSLEFYRSTATQRKNMRRILDLIGYKLHWYKSAILNLKITNNSADTIVLSTSITLANADYITQRVYNQYNEVPPYLILPFQVNWQSVGTINIKPGESVTVEAVQGELQSVSFTVESIVDNKYYLPTTLIDQDHMWLQHNVVDANGQLTSDLSCWNLVEDLNTQTSIGRFFQFDVDEFDQPYIELVPYWEGKGYAKVNNGETFTLYYLNTLGELGNVGQNVFSYSGRIANLTTDMIDIDGIEVPSILIEHSDNNTYGISNTDAPGCNIETVEEAYKNSGLWINTYNTLVTIKDFEDFTKSYGEMSNCRAIDTQRAYEFNETIQSDKTLSDEAYDGEGNLVPNSKFKKFIDNIKTYVEGNQKTICHTNIQTSEDLSVSGRATLSFDWDLTPAQLPENRMFVYTYAEITDLLHKNKDISSSFLDTNEYDPKEYSFASMDIHTTLDTLLLEIHETSSTGEVSVSQRTLCVPFLFYGIPQEGIKPWDDTGLSSYSLTKDKVISLTGLTNEDSTPQGKAYIVLRFDLGTLLKSQFSTTVNNETQMFTASETLINYVLNNSGSNIEYVLKCVTGQELLKQRLKDLSEIKTYSLKLYSIYNNFNSFLTGYQKSVLNKPYYVLPTGHYMCSIGAGKNGEAIISWYPVLEDQVNVPYQDVYWDGDVLCGITFIVAPETTDEGVVINYPDLYSPPNDTVNSYLIDTHLEEYLIEDYENLSDEEKIDAINKLKSIYPKKFKEYNMDYLCESSGAFNTEIPNGILEKISSNKSIRVDCSFGTVRVFEWVAKGTVYLHEPVDKNTAEEILISITQHLAEVFSPENVGIGNKIAYMEIVQAVKDSDTRIRFFDPEMELMYVDKDKFDTTYFNDVSIWTYVDGPNNNNSDGVLYGVTGNNLQMAAESLKG